MHHRMWVFKSEIFTCQFWNIYYFLIYTERLCDFWIFLDIIHTGTLTCGYSKARSSAYDVRNSNYSKFYSQRLRDFFITFFIIPLKLLKTSKKESHIILSVFCHLQLLLKYFNPYLHAWLVKVTYMHAINKDNLTKEDNISQCQY